MKELRGSWMDEWTKDELMDGWRRELWIDEYELMNK
jgi:hypothetical protein